MWSCHPAKSSHHPKNIIKEQRSSKEQFTWEIYEYALPTADLINKFGNPQEIVLCKGVPWAPFLTRWRWWTREEESVKYKEMRLLYPSILKSFKWLYNYVFILGWQTCILQLHIRNWSSQYELIHNAMCHMQFEEVACHLHFLDHSKASKSIRRLKPENPIPGP